MCEAGETMPASTQSSTHVLSTCSGNRVHIGGLCPQQQGLSLLCIVTAVEKDPSLRGVQQHKLLFRVADFSGSVTLALPLGILRSAAAAAAAKSAAPGSGAVSATSSDGPLQLSDVASDAAAAAAADTAAAAASVAAAGTTTAEAEALKLLLPPSAVLLLEGAYTSWSMSKLVLSVSDEASRSRGTPGRVSVLGFFSFPFSLSPYVSASFAGNADKPWQKPPSASPATPVSVQGFREASIAANNLLLQNPLQEQDCLSLLGPPDPIFALEDG
ncbi:uncharacterized protein LOC34618234 [Cyclospora cayetanensis]|uniref:Uncharacterized protein LOC34618234 n=1 Tax=Cyclospora cayetanensis TaxID=88456 RepID=A0A6P6RXT4_9EIME|nr:uncharacterized protein LOC34618234 [Cyclospora cayetanensis]